MDSGLDRDLILEMYVTETQELLDQLEQLVLDSEQDGGIRSIVHEVFRIMHTIKGSSTTMAFENMAVLSHSIEDIFFYIREGKADSFDEHGLTNIVLVSIDFMKGEIEKIKEGGQPDGDASGLIDEIQTFLSAMKQEGSHPSKESPVSPLKRYKAVVVFEEDCQMENIRAFLMVNKLKAVAKDISYQPPDISENEESAQVIREKGFLIELTSELGIDEIQSNLEGNSFVKHIKLEEVPAAHSYEDKSRQNENHTVQGKQMDDAGSGPSKTSRSRESSDRFERISVDVHKLDNLLDMVGELVISQAMVVQHPELKGLPLEEFYDAVGHLQKITTDLQDIVMSIRMVPLSMTFQKMHRIVRDMSSKFGKDVQLKIIGAETEVDKNIIDHISDPLMHLIRNAVDHGIETIEERVQRGKPGKGTITLEAKNLGGDVWIIIKDDGRGLNRRAIAEKAYTKGLTSKTMDKLSDQEIFSFIMQPGFSTKETVTEYSGRGVGMDVVMKNVESIGGTVLIDSTEGEGTIFSIKIPLTLAIVDGMVLRVGNSSYIIPTTSILACFKAREEDIITDPDGNEMIMNRGQCYSILRLHEMYGIKSDTAVLTEGIMVLAGSGTKGICLFVDELVAQQQVVVKRLPRYFKRIKGIAGCTLLGNGDISFILDVSQFL